MTKGEETRLRNLKLKRKAMKLSPVESRHLKRLSDKAETVVTDTKLLVRQTEALAHRSHQLADKSHRSVHKTKEMLRRRNQPN
jgi:hypothetical protein